MNGWEDQKGWRGGWFTDDLWRMLNPCWETQPENRPGIEAVLECLEEVPMGWKPLSPQVDEDVESDESDWDLTK